MMTFTLLIKDNYGNWSEDVGPDSPVVEDSIDALRGYVDALRALGGDWTEAEFAAEDSDGVRHLGVL